MPGDSVRVLPSLPRKFACLKRLQTSAGPPAGGPGICSALVSWKRCKDFLFPFCQAFSCSVLLLLKCRVTTFGSPITQAKSCPGFSGKLESSSAHVMASSSVQDHFADLDLVIS
jgi:hypothetical protein